MKVINSNYSFKGEITVLEDLIIFGDCTFSNCNITIVGRNEIVIYGVTKINGGIYIRSLYSGVVTPFELCN